MVHYGMHYGMDYVIVHVHSKDRSVKSTLKEFDE